MMETKNANSNCDSIGRLRSAIETNLLLGMLMCILMQVRIIVYLRLQSHVLYAHDYQSNVIVIAGCHHTGRIFSHVQKIPVQSITGLAYSMRFFIFTCYSPRIYNIILSRISLPLCMCMYILSVFRHRFINLYCQPM